MPGSDLSSELRRRAEQSSEQTLRRAEASVEQIERDGAVKFSVLFLWYLVRYGYRRNPYEVEAYARTAEIKT